MRKALEGAVGLFEVQLTLVPILLELLLVSDVPSDLVFVQTDGTYTVPPCPETPAEQRPFRSQQLPVDPGRTLALQVPDRHGDAIPGGHAQQHVDVVRHCLTLHQLDILLTAQIPQDLPNSSPDLSVQHLATVLRKDHDVILTVPLHVGLALPIFHGGPPAPPGPSSRRTVPNSRRKRQSL